MPKNYQYDSYEDFEDLFDPMENDRQARRKRKAKINHTPKKSREEIIDEIADTVGLEAGFNTTYQPGLFEEGWLLQSIKPFYDMAQITDVLGRVKGGKEASVYRCAGHESTGEELLAAKVYRPRMFRNLSNDKMYREGRTVLSTDGKEITERDKRSMRALNKNTSFGQQMAHTSWLMHEYKTLQTLYNAGVAVPKPISSGENAILMGYIGDEKLGAPTLIEVDLAPEETEPLFNRLMRYIDIMLDHDIIHGDLSAYNILYWAGDITLIDFPQVTNLNTNSNARMILHRDVTRVCEYFTKQGFERDPDRITDTLWQRYANEIPLEELEENMAYAFGDYDDDEDGESYDE